LKGTGSTSLRKDLRCVSFALYHSTRSTSLRKDLRCVSYAQRGVRSDGCHVSRLFIGIASTNLANLLLFLTINRFASTISVNPQYTLTIPKRSRMRRTSVLYYLRALSCETNILQIDHSNCLKFLIYLILK